MTDYDINELTKAGFLELACPPASPDAKALVADIINIIEQAEQRQLTVIPRFSVCNCVGGLFT